MAKDEWKFIDEYRVLEYACGLRAGDTVELLRDIHVTNHRHEPTGKVHHAGEHWLVLPGAEQDPGTVWLKQPDGRRHIWDDSPEIFEWFRVVTKA